ncbi:hypothetical protein B0J13DRAFT_572616 [Dactylonectria estremocensis]|uniref:Clr5 domain-containing protein n=1 Tax=Dactylonectria estremocensis TaxID=1079267 RepID=A0A9P9D981_9HYPO|nr:hypothetical protein B0J13DRAFT_572616 [Dactylonectria estremocensis]
MPRPVINISHLRQEITILYEDELTIQSIIESLSSDYGIGIGRSTLYRNLKEWGLSRQVKTTTSPALRDRIKQMFFQDCLKDKLILRRLQDEGYTISIAGLRKIRKEHGMFRR